MPEITPEQQMEVIRRRANLGASSAGIGADAANSLNPPGAIAGEGGTQLMTNPPEMVGGAAGAPSDRAGARLGQEKDESERITDHLMRRQKVLEKRGQGAFL